MFLYKSKLIMSLLSFFLFKTGITEKFESVTKYVTIDGKKMPSVKLEDKISCKTFELGHKIYKNQLDNLVYYETFFSNGEKIVLNHLSKHDSKGNLLELKTYYGDNDKYDASLDVCYIVDLINESLALNTNKSFWDEAIVSTDDNANCIVHNFSQGFLISKNSSYNPKKIQINGKTIVELIGNDIEICFVDYLKYQNMNILMYCSKYDIEQELDSSQINNTASDIAKRKIVGHCIIASNENLDEAMMGRVVINALNFNQKEYEERQKKDLIKMYAQAYVLQNPKLKN